MAANHEAQEIPHNKSVYITNGNSDLSTKSSVLTADKMISALAIACIITAVSEWLGKVGNIPPLPLSTTLSILSATIFSDVFAGLVPAGDAMVSQKYSSDNNLNENYAVIHL